jgi:hypothetical protein
MAKARAAPNTNGASHGGLMASTPAARHDPSTTRSAPHTTSPTPPATPRTPAKPAALVSVAPVHRHVSEGHEHTQTRTRTHKHVPVHQREPRLMRSRRKTSGSETNGRVSRNSSVEN